jgi:hypothetical protein
VQKNLKMQCFFLDQICATISKAYQNGEEP